MRNLRDVLIGLYQGKIISKRRQKAYNRLKLVIRQKFGNIRLDSNTLKELEMQDKKLNRDFYYEPNEPDVYV